MPGRKKRSVPKKPAEILAEVRRSQTERDRSYREQAMKLLPHICGRCGREFSGKTLRELTVHHKDHNHDNNPPDGSNWELLCLYCHDDEHSRTAEGGYAGGSTLESHGEESLGHNPFGGLADLLKPESDQADSETSE